MAGTVKVDDKTGKVLSAELDVNYAAFLQDANRDLARKMSIAARVERALKSLGVSNRLFKEADHKKLASTSNAAALLKDFRDAQREVTSAYHAYDGTNYDAFETKARWDLAVEVSKKADARIKEIEKSIADLKAECAKIEDQKKETLAQITKATEPKGAEFRKELAKLRAGAETLSKEYGHPNWDFSLTQKVYLKKK